ncbi:glutamate--tRNA ligase [Gammaproteobacteria bacterium]|nr:glutamate--tRNA ligase [Gammaproteobacteria bacterium]
MAAKIRVRFAPSPTGSLHLGGVRTALYNYLLAKHTGGDFILRVEDTDLERNQSHAAQSQMQDLNWLGLEWEEGPDIGGGYAPYAQSQRLEIYHQYAKQLVEEKKAFYCFLTVVELDALHPDDNRQVLSPHRDLSVEEAKLRIENGDPHVIRFRNDHGQKPYPFDDLVHGKTTLHADMVGDFVLIRSNGQPVYNFCCVIDDYLMRVSHVLRGEEHLSNTLRQIMVYEALNWDMPKFGHLSMILGPTRKKLSKRDDAAALSDFVKRGFVPAALLNYVALLGWSSPDAKEVFTLSELIESFDIARVNKSPAMFDLEKLRWINHQHLKQMSAVDVYNAMAQQMKVKMPHQDWFSSFWRHLGEQFFTLAEVVESMHYFSHSPKENEEQLTDEGKVVLTSLQDSLNTHKSEYLSEKDFNQIMTEITNAHHVKGRKLFVPIRLALIGLTSGIEIKILVDLLTREEMLRRIKDALSR